MDFLALVALYFLEFIRLIVVIDVILSFVAFFLGIRIMIPFFEAVLLPIYKKINKLLPTQFAMFDMTPLVVVFAISILETIIRSLFPSVVFFY